MYLAFNSSFNFWICHHHVLSLKLQELAKAPIKQNEKNLKQEEKERREGEDERRIRKCWSHVDLYKQCNELLHFLSPCGCVSGSNKGLCKKLLLLLYRVRTNIMGLLHMFFSMLWVVLVKKLIYIKWRKYSGNCRDHLGKKVNK